MSQSRYSANAQSQGRTLRRLYLTLFLRGRTSRGMNPRKTPKSVISKLWVTLGIYALVGLLVANVRHMGLFAMSFYLHGMGLLFLGMFTAASAGEVLFNKDEAEILMHRPIGSGVLLRAKIAVLLQVSLYLAWSFNLAGLFFGLVGPHGSVVFPLAHLVSTALAAVFCTGCVVLVYQICLRWFGRERLESLMTATQMLVTVALVGASQATPVLLRKMGNMQFSGDEVWWMTLLPPAWFAGMDQVAAGHGSTSSWRLAGIGLAVTLAVAAFAFVKLADVYQAGVLALGESAPRRSRPAGKRRWLDRLIDRPPLAWGLGDPVTRAAFRLTAAYMFRDRDTKLRLYPGLAPLFMMPAIFVFKGITDRSDEFGITFAGAYLGLLPVFSMYLLQFSQQWQASDVFRSLPVAGPAPLIHGATRATLCLLSVPAMAALAILVWALPGGWGRSVMLLPGMILMPVYALIPGALNRTIPLSRPVEEAKSTSRGLMLMLPMFGAMALAGLSIVARRFGWFGWFLACEAIGSVVLAIVLAAKINRSRWTPLD